jgi:hypothetical protein
VAFLLVGTGANASTESAALSTVPAPVSLAAVIRIWAVDVPAPFGPVDTNDG